MTFPERSAPAANPSPEPSRPTWQIQAEERRSQLLAQMGADRWPSAGFRGKGVKIAVLDTGWRGWRNHLGKALPASVLAHSFRADGNLEWKDNQHGILCAEVIHHVTEAVDSYHSRKFWLGKE